MKQRKGSLGQIHLGRFLKVPPKFRVFQDMFLGRYLHELPKQCLEQIHLRLKTVLRKCLPTAMFPDCCSNVVFWGSSILAVHNFCLEGSLGHIHLGFKCFSGTFPERPSKIKSSAAILGAEYLQRFGPSTNAVFSAINGSEEGSRKRNPKVPPTCPDFFEGSSFLHLIGFSRLSNQAF